MEKKEKKAPEGVEKADLGSVAMETGERTCRSRHVRDPRPWRQVAAVAHFCCLRDKVAVEMRLVCPRDVKKMLPIQAGMVHWKRCAAKHECEESKDGV